MKLEFVGQSSRDGDNWQANSGRLVNCYREPAGGKAGYTLKSVLGLSSFANLSGVFVRALDEVGGYLYACCGGRLQRINDVGTVTDLGAVTESGLSSISGNDGKVTIVSGGIYQVWDGATLSTPATGAFAGFGSMTYIGGYTVLTELGGKQFQWSGLVDPTNLPGLNFSSADGRDDNTVQAMAINGQLYIFKEHSHEVWYNTGGAGALAFERQAGGVVDIGLKAFGLICEFKGGAFFVGDDGKAHIIGIGPVSSPPVETAIKLYGPQTCLTWEDEGHTFCAIVFSDAAAWVYDVATGEWCERAEDIDLLPWKASVSAKLGNEWFVGRTGGEVLRFGRTNSDADLPLVREATSTTLENDAGRFILSELEIFPRIGFDAATVEVQLSGDSGLTWGNARQRSWAVGEYGRRIIWRALGQFRQVTARIRWSDPVDIPINTQCRVKI